MANSRVIFVNRVYWPNESATAQLLTDLAEALAQHGWDVHVVCAGPQREATRRGVGIHRSGHAAEHHGLASRARGYVHFLGFARSTVRRLVRPGDVVVIKTDPPMLGAALTGPAVARGAHVVQWIQDIYPEIAMRHGGGAMQWLFAPLRVMRDRAWQRSAACVPVGTDMAAHVARHGVAPARIHPLPNWAPRELEASATPEAIAARRAAWGWQGKFVVAYSGNLGRVHEFRTLLAAAARLRAEPDIQFVFIGGGARLAEVRDAAAAAGNIQFLPAQPRAELAATLAAADVHAVTLLPGFESLVHPSKVAGALAVGRPVAFVGPPGSALACALATAECGASFAPGEDEFLADTLRRWRDDAAWRERLGANGRRHYAANLQFAAVLPQWQALLRSLAGTGLPSSGPGR